MEWRIGIIWWIIFCIRYSKSFWIYINKHGEKTFNPLVRIYINKIDRRIPPKIKTGYYLERLTPETMKLLGGTESKITKNENDEHVSNLELLK